MMPKPEISYEYNYLLTLIFSLDMRIKELEQHIKMIGNNFIIWEEMMKEKKWESNNQ
jgi:hypothetical protein